MGSNEWKFVSVDQTGLPNAKDRTTIRKAAMQSFRRKERIERVKAFAAQTQDVETNDQLGIPASHEITVKRSSSEAPESFDESISQFLQSPGTSGKFPKWPHISRQLGYPIAQPHEDVNVMNYLLDYCM